MISGNFLGNDLDPCSSFNPFQSPVRNFLSHVFKLVHMVSKLTLIFDLETLISLYFHDAY